ncbi:MAG TPA: SDR family oxidoreductase [Stellaceae bacterium]|nr:SDR family oxidoreductase [Stellaceae bacterium]
MAEPPFSLEGKLALVTGAARGLGFAMAASLARAGAQVLLNGRSEARLAPAVEALRGEGLAVGPIVFDVADEAAVAAAFAAIERQHDRLDILISNVGFRNRRPIDELLLGDMRQMLEVNLTAPFGLAKRAAALMLPRHWGRLILVTSIAGPLSRAGDAAYTASKGGLAALTRSLAAEYGPKGVTANAIAPGFFATETNADRVADAQVRAFIERRVPLRRWGRPAEIGGAAVFLASEEASYVNGHVLTVDGGMSVSF